MTDANKAILVKLILIDLIISFVSISVPITISGYHTNYHLFLPLSYPLGLSYSIAPEAVYPPQITWYLWLLFPSLEYALDLQLTHFQFFFFQTSFFSIFLVINTIALLLTRWIQGKIHN